MAIEVNNIADLKANKIKATKGDILTDNDYVLRDKKQEAKDGKSRENTRDLTEATDKYEDRLAQLKAEARAEAKADMQDEMKEMRAMIAELQKPKKAK